MAAVVVGVVSMAIWTVVGNVVVFIVAFMVVVVFLAAVVADWGGCGFLIVFLVGIGGLIIIMGFLGVFLVVVVVLFVVVVGTAVVVGFLLITNSENARIIHYKICRRKAIL